LYHFQEDYAGRSQDYDLMQVEGLEGQDKLSWMHLSHKLTGLQGMKSDLARAAPGFCHFDFI
jgi:hypothetical protein